MSVEDLIPTDVIEDTGAVEEVDPELLAIWYAIYATNTISSVFCFVAFAVYGAIMRWRPTVANRLSFRMTFKNVVVDVLFSVAQVSRFILLRMQQKPG